MQTPYPLVFVSSLSVLSFELLLIRIFTIRLSYHYASLIISLSMAGLVMGGLLVYYSKMSRKLQSTSQSSQPLNYFAAALAISYPSGVFTVLRDPPRSCADALGALQIVYLVFFIASVHCPILSLRCNHLIGPLNLEGKGKQDLCQ